MSKRSREKRRVRLGTLWFLSAVLLVVYFALPDGDDPPALESNPTGAEVTADAPKKFEIVHVSPADASPSSAVVVSFTGPQDSASVRAFAGKTELTVLAARPGTIVVRLPTEVAPGHLKLRLGAGEERSKPYDIRVKATNWRKPFRNLAGGFALLLFGIAMFARGLREAAGLKSARFLGRIAKNPYAAAGTGALLGALVQCTTAAAGILAGLVSSNLVAIASAAAAFVGAQFGAAAAPLVVSGLMDGRGGLIVIAIGMLWVGLAGDRRIAALGQFLLGAGLIAFGLQTMRPGFEPFVSAPALLPVIEGVRADTLLGVARCALLGAALAAALQGPVPLLMLVLVLAQTTGHWDARTALAVLSGSGAGAALGALLTSPAGQRCRRLARLHCLLGLGSTLFGAATVGLWTTLVDRAFVGVPEIEWGSRVLMPNVGIKLAVAFAASQLAAMVLLVPIAAPLTRWLERRWPEQPLEEAVDAAQAPALVRSSLVRILQSQSEALAAAFDLVLSGQRAAARTAEHHLAGTRAAVEDLLAMPLRALPATKDGTLLGRAAFTCLQLQRSLEALVLQAERLTESRVAALVGAEGVAPILEDEDATLREMHRLLAEGMTALVMALEGHARSDLDAALAREIEMNRLEAGTRDALPRAGLDPARVRTHLHVLEMSDAYEGAGNQLCRLAQVLHEALSTTALDAALEGERHPTSQEDAATTAVPA